MSIRGDRHIQGDLPNYAAADTARASTATGTPPSSDDPVANMVRGYPGVRVPHTETGGQSADDPAAGFVTGYPGTRTAEHLHAGTHGLDDPVAGVLTGYPGERVPHSETGGQSADDPAAGFLTGYPGTRTAGHVGTRGPDSGPVDRHDVHADPETVGRKGDD